MIRVYQFKRKFLRDNISLRPYESIIKNGFRCIRPDVRVDVFEDKYVVHGRISAKELRTIGKRICAHPALGRLCKTYGNSTQLFVCVKKDEERS